MLYLSQFHILLEFLYLSVISHMACQKTQSVKWFSHCSPYVWSLNVERLVDFAQVTALHPPQRWWKKLWRRTSVGRRWKIWTHVPPVLRKSGPICKSFSAMGLSAKHVGVWSVPTWFRGSVPTSGRISRPRCAVPARNTSRNSKPRSTQSPLCLGETMSWVIFFDWVRIWGVPGMGCKSNFFWGGCV